MSCPNMSRRRGFLTQSSLTERVIALEAETEKRWKPSHASTQDRLSRMNSLCGFFDASKVVFPALGESPEEIGPGFIEKIRLNKD